MLTKFRQKLNGAVTNMALKQAKKLPSRIQLGLSTTFKNPIGSQSSRPDSYWFTALPARIRLVLESYLPESQSSVFPLEAALDGTGTLDISKDLVAWMNKLIKHI